MMRFLRNVKNIEMDKVEEYHCIKILRRINYEWNLEKYSSSYNFWKLKILKLINCDNDECFVCFL